MIRLICLGSSASTPTVRHVPSHFAVKYGGVFLFDCAEGCQRQMMKYNVPYGSLQAVFLTHLHADHVLGLPGVVQTLNLSGRKDPLNIFGPPGVAAFIQCLFQIPSFRADFPLRVKELPLKKSKAFHSDLFVVSGYPVSHSCPALGYVLEEKPKIKFHETLAKSKGIRGRLFTEILEKGSVMAGGQTVSLEEVTFKEKGKKLVFTGDTSACKATLVAAKEANVLVHDSSFLEDQRNKAEETKHATAASAAELAKKAGVKKLVLTHFGNRYNDRQFFLREAQPIFSSTDLAEEGKEWLV